MTDPTWNFHCADFAAARYKEVTGKSLWRVLGRHPKSPAEAAALYRKHGVRTMKELVSKVMGEAVDPKLAMRGDIMMVDNALGICRGEVIECMDRMQPIHRAECAWRFDRT